MKFCSSGEKMRNAGGNQGEKSDSENKKRKRTRTTFNSSLKRVTRKFYVVVVQNNGKEVYKKVCCTWKIAFLLIRPMIVFSPFSLPSPLSITRFYILFEQTKNIIENFAFIPG